MADVRVQEEVQQMEKSAISSNIVDVCKERLFLIRDRGSPFEQVHYFDVVVQNTKTTEVEVERRFVQEPLENAPFTAAMLAVQMKANNIFVRSIHRCTGRARYGAAPSHIEQLKSCGSGRNFSTMLLHTNLLLPGSTRGWSHATAAPGTRRHRSRQMHRQLSSMSFRKPAIQRPDAVLWPRPCTTAAAYVGRLI